MAQRSPHNRPLKSLQEHLSTALAPDVADKVLKPRKPTGKSLPTPEEQAQAAAALEQRKRELTDAYRKQFMQDRLAEGFILATREGTVAKLLGHPLTRRIIDMETCTEVEPLSALDGQKYVLLKGKTVKFESGKKAQLYMNTRCDVHMTDQYQKISGTRRGWFCVTYADVSSAVHFKLHPNEEAQPAQTADDDE